MKSPHDRFLKRFSPVAAAAILFAPVFLRAQNVSIATGGSLTIEEPSGSMGATFDMFPTVGTLPVNNLFVANGVSGAEVNVFPNTGGSSGGIITLLEPTVTTLPGDARLNIFGGTILNGLITVGGPTTAGGSLSLSEFFTTTGGTITSFVPVGLTSTAVLTAYSGGVTGLVLSGNTATTLGATNGVIFNGLNPINALTLSSGVVNISGGSLTLMGNTATTVGATNGVIFNGLNPTNALTLSSDVVNISGGSLTLAGSTAVTSGTVTDLLAPGALDQGLVIDDSGGVITSNLTNTATTDGTITGVVVPSGLLQVSDLNAADGNLVLSPVDPPATPTVTEITPSTLDITPPSGLNESVGQGLSVPEPSTWSAALLGGGALLVLGRFRRRGL